MSVDSIGNFLASMRNVLARAGKSVSVPYSSMKHRIAEVLKSEGYLRDIQVSGEGIEKKLTLFFKYVENESVIHSINQISKPGRRIYVNVSSIPTVIGGLGIAVMTTNKGVMTNKQAKDNGIGGEIVCTVW